MSDKIHKRDVNWLCVIFNLQIFLAWFCGLHFVIYEAPFVTTFFGVILILLGVIGVTAGSHRLWAHRSYKATTPLKIFLMLCHTIAGHTTIYHWVQLHRLHHKYFKTDLDPFNPRKGFFFSHFIANNLDLSQAQEKALNEIDMSDLENDKVVMFQKRFYYILFAVVTLLLPLNAPMEYWGDSMWNAVLVIGWFRFATTYHLSLLIHSASTIFDYNDVERKSYDSNAIFLINKSNWLSYHYLAPWDYQTSEYGKYGTDCTSKFIRVCAALEFAFDLKTLDTKAMREAINKAVSEDKSVIKCLQDIENESFLPEGHYLTPAKYY